MKRISRLSILGMGVCLLIIGYCIFRIVCPEPEGVRRQNIEESLAGEYLDYIFSDTSGGSHGSPAFSDVQVSVPENKDTGIQSENTVFEDDRWYERDGITYTPDYAKGMIECVLEIPDEDIRIRRGVYTGTAEEITYDLDIWMVTAARPDYELGKTHYLIYGHNHTVQDLSFNRLPLIETGDSFTLTDRSGIRKYIVSEIKYMTRENVASQIADNFELPPELCFIATCARGEHAGLDLVITGRLSEFIPADEIRKSRYKQ